MLSEGIKENDLYVIYNEVNHRKGEPKSSNFQEYKERIHNGEIVHCICTATIGEGVEIHNTIPANCYILSNRFKSVHNYTQFACRLRGVINELGVFTSNLTKKDYSDNVEFNSKFDYSVYKSLPSTIGKKHNDIHWFKLLQQALSARNTLHTTYIKENGVLDKRCGKYNAFFNALRDIPFKLKVGIAFNIFGINCITSNRGVEFIDVDRVQELRTKECNLDINQLRRLFYTLVINLMQKAPAGEEKNTEYQLFSTYLGYEFKEGVITPPSKEYIPYKVSYEKHLPYKEMVQVALDFHREIDWLIIDMDSKVSRHLDNVTYVDKDGKEYVGTYESIAKELGITANNLRVRMTRRKVKLSNVESGKGLYVECFKEGLRCKESYDNVKEAIEDFKAKNPKCKEHHIKNFVQGLNASVDGYTVVDKVEKEKEQKKWDSVEYVMGFIKSVKFVNPEDIDENSLKLGWNWFKVNEDGTKTVITVPYNMSQSEALGKGYQPAWNLLGSGYGVIDTDCYNVITTDIMAELDRQGVHYTVNPKKPYSRHYWFIDQDNGTTIHGNGFDILRGGKNQQVFEIGRKLI